MTATGKLLDLARTMQTVALVSENVKIAKQGIKKKKKSKKLTGLAIKNIVGIKLIREQAKLSVGI